MTANGLDRISLSAASFMLPQPGQYYESGFQAPADSRALEGKSALAEGWVDERDKAILNTIYYCESCNMILEPGDPDVERHKNNLPSHKIRKVLIVRCGYCGNIVTDSHAQYNAEKNQFWCKNCVSDHRSGLFGQ